jgi:hypothetical protein
MNPMIQFRKGTPLFLVIFVLGCFGFSIPAPRSSLHFIEQLFDLCPDGGSGFVEIGFFAVPLFLISLAIKRTIAQSRQ